MKSLSKMAEDPLYDSTTRSSLIPVINPDWPIMRGIGGPLAKWLISRVNAAEDASTSAIANFFSKNPGHKGPPPMLDLSLPAPGSRLDKNMLDTYEMLAALKRNNNIDVSGMVRPIESGFQRYNYQSKINNAAGLGWLAQALMLGGVAGTAVGAGRAIPQLARVWKTRQRKEKVPGDGEEVSVTLPGVKTATLDNKPFDVRPEFPPPSFSNVVERMQKLTRAAQAAAAAPPAPKPAPAAPSGVPLGAADAVREQLAGVKKYLELPENAPYVKKLYKKEPFVDAPLAWSGELPAGAPHSQWRGMIMPATALALLGGTYGAISATDWVADKVRDHVLSKRKEKAKAELAALLAESMAGSKTASLSGALSSAADTYVKEAQDPVPGEVVTSGPGHTQLFSDGINTLFGTLALAELGVSAAAFIAARKARMRGDPNIAKAKALEAAVQRLRMSRPVTVRVSRGPTADIGLPPGDYVPGLSVPSVADVTLPYGEKSRKGRAGSELNLHKLGSVKKAYGATGGGFIPAKQRVDPKLGTSVPGGTGAPTPGGSADPTANWLPSEKSTNPAGLKQKGPGAWATIMAGAKSVGGDLAEVGSEITNRFVASNNYLRPAAENLVAASGDYAAGVKNLRETTDVINPKNWGRGIMSFLQGNIGQSIGGGFSRLVGPKVMENFGTLLNAKG